MATMWGGETSSERSALGQDTAPVFKDSRTPPPVDVRWELGARETLTVRGTMLFRVKNTGTRARTIRLALVSSGAGGLGAQTDLGSVHLEPGQSTTLRPGLDKLALRSANVSTQLVVQAEYETDDGHTVRVSAEPRFYHSSPDGRATMVYDVETMVRDYGGGLVPGQPAVAGYDVGAAGAKLEAPATQGYLQGPTTIALGASADHAEVATDSAQTVIPAAPPGSGQRVCTTWRVSFEDAGFGEDYGTAQGLQDLPAAYTYATVKDSNQAVKWQGYLDGSGCTPYLALGVGSFTLEQKSQLSRNGANVNVYTRLFGNQFIWVFNTAFTVTNGSGYTTVQVVPPVQVCTTNVNGVVAQMLRTIDNGFQAGTYTVFSNTGCPGMNAWDSCAVGSSAYIGQLYPDGSSDVNSKIIIAHEIGHTVQSVAMGMLMTNYGGDWDAPQFCNCSHIDDPQGINNLHCLQSKEYVSAAELEGFAQFMAAKTWNNPAETNCGWAYYKPFREHQGEFGSVIVAPPMARLCGTPPGASGLSWMEHNCALNMTNHGVEWDWQQFLWDVTTQGTTKSTMADLYNIYKTSAACGGSCNGKDVHWEDLKNAARVYYGANDPRYANWLARADNAGVNH